MNVASACGYTDVNYRELQALRNKYDDRLAIVAFPCNQFGRQEPGSWEEISAFVGQRFGVTFPVMNKVRNAVTRGSSGMKRRRWRVN